MSEENKGKPGEEKAARRPYSSLRYTKYAYRKAVEKLFVRDHSDRTKCKGFKLKADRFRLDVRRKYIAQRVVRHWNRFPREFVDAPSLEVSQLVLAQQAS